MYKVATVIGARPQFVKAAVVSPALRERCTEILIHTGQHYDYELSGAFFDQLEIHAPDHNSRASAPDPTRSRRAAC